MVNTKLRNYIDKDKETKTQEEFAERLIIKLKRNFKLSEETEKAYRDFAANLYNLDAEDYQEWLKAFNQVEMQFINGNIGHIAYFAEKNSVDSLNEAYEIYKKKNSILMRSMPAVNSTTVNEDREGLLETYDKIVATVSNHVDGSIALKIKEELMEAYDEEEVSPLVRDYYDEVLNNINKDVLSYAKTNLSKISACVQHIQEIKNVQYIKDRNTKDYKKKNLGKMPAYSGFDR